MNIFEFITSLLGPYEPIFGPSGYMTPNYGWIANAAFIKGVALGIFMLLRQLVNVIFNRR
jgi:hypothetical protein